MVKICKVCGATEDTAKFYTSMTSRCQECHKEKVRENRLANLQHYREYDVRRFKEDPKVKERHLRYRKTEAGKASMQKSRDKWISADPNRRASHIILNNAVRNGRVIKPNTCSSCGAAGRIEGHHHDYTLPLSVIWLCSTCHDKVHKEQDETK